MLMHKNITKKIQKQIFAKFTIKKRELKRLYTHVLFKGKIYSHEILAPNF